MIKKSLLIWLLIIPCAILNGALRESVLTPLMGHYALPLSGILLSLIIFTFCYFCLPLIGKGSTSTYGKIGTLWIILTIAFEFGLGHFIMKQPLAELLKAYNPLHGNLWLLVLATTGLSPSIVSQLKHLKTTNHP